MTTARFPSRASIRLLGLMSRWTMPCSWACCRPRAAWWTKLQALATGSGPRGLDQLRQVEALDVLHGEDEALAEPDGRVGGDDVGVVELGRVADLARGSGRARRGGSMRWLLTTLSTSLPAHELVLGQVDDAHAALAELAEDLVVGVVGQARGQRAGRRRRRRGAGRSASIDRPASEETTGAGESGRAWASRSRPRKLSEDISATRRRQSGHSSRCLLTDSAEASSSLPRP